MKKSKSWLLTLLTALSFLMLSSCFGPPEFVPKFPKSLVWLNRPSDFPLPSFKGKVTLFEFFTEDCSNCIKSQQLVRKILAKEGNGIQVLGIYTPIGHQTTTMNEIKQFLKTHKIGYPVLYDGKRTIRRAFHIRSWPTLIVSDAKGKITDHIHGMQHPHRIYEAIRKAKKSFSTQ